MELHQLQAFATVARTGSLTAAARELHVSQPAVSAHLKGLETELGVPLFDRLPRGVRLTDAGRHLLPHAHEALGQVDQLRAAASRIGSGLDGTVRLGIIDCGVDLRVAAISSGLKSSEPGLRLGLVAANSGQHIAGLRAYEVDVAIVEGEIRHRDVGHEDIAVSHVGVIGPKAWEAELRDADWHALATRPWIFQSEECSYSQLTHQVCREHGLELNAQYRTEQFVAVYDLVRSGLALSMADRHDAMPRVEAGELFLWPRFSYEMPVRLAWLRKREAEPAIAAVLRAVRSAHRSIRLVS